MEILRNCNNVGGTGGGGGGGDLLGHAVHLRKDSHHVKAPERLLGYGSRLVDPGIPLAKRTTALHVRGFDIAEESLDDSISDLRVRSKL